MSVNCHTTKYLNKLTEKLAMEKGFGPSTSDPNTFLSKFPHR